MGGKGDATPSSICTRGGVAYVEGLASRDESLIKGAAAIILFGTGLNKNKNQRKIKKKIKEIKFY